MRQYVRKNPTSIVGNSVTHGTFKKYIVPFINVLLWILLRVVGFFLQIRVYA